MPLITWKTNYSVGVNILDSQHKEIIKLINELYDSMKSGKTQNVIQGIVNSLEIYAEYHFQTEEELLEKTGYKEIENHKKFHNEYVNELVLLKNQVFEGSTISINFTLTNFLSNWWNNHILIEDMKYVKIMKEKKVI